MSKYLIRDRSKPGFPIIGRAEMRSGHGPSEVLNLAQTGHLLIQPEMSDERRAEIAQAQAEAEEKLNDPEEALRKQSEAAEAEARKLPEGEYALEDLKIKQLYALCEQKGIPAYGTKAECVARINDHNAKVAAEATADDEVNLDDLTVAELKKVAKGYKVSTSGSKEELIERIMAAAEGAETPNGETEG